MTRPRRCGGQATVELLGALPLVLVVGMFVFQALAVGYAVVLASSAAEAGALAQAAGGDPERGARESLPGWSRARARVIDRDGTVTVRLEPPSALRVVARALTVRADAAVARR